MKGSWALAEKYRGREVLAIGAYPEDIELGAGGTVACLAEDGVHVTMVVVCAPDALEARMEEAGRAAELLGASLRFLFPGREMRVEDLKIYELVGKIDGLVKECDPGAVLTHAGTNLDHDHVLVHKACISAQRLRHFDMLGFHPANSHPISAPFRPEVFVDISRTIGKKVAAIQEHKTRGGRNGLPPGHYVEVAREYGRLSGVEFAEGLEVSRLRLG